MGELNGDVLGTTLPASFKSLIVAVIPATPPGMQCFWFTISPGKGNSNGFYLAFPTMSPPTTPVKEPMWWFCQVGNVSTPSLHSKTREMATGWVLDPLWLQLLLKFYGPPDLHRPWLFLEATVMFWIPGISMSLESVSSSPPNAWSFSFLQGTFSYPGKRP